MKLVFGLPVLFSSGDDGEVVDVIVDPHASVVSHVVVAPPHHSSRARLIPIADVVAAQSRERLQCSKDLDVYPLIESNQFVKMSEPIETEDEWDVGIEHVSALPYFSAAVDEFEPFGYPLGGDDEDVSVSFHRIPKGKVEIRRESDVVDAAGNRVGRVDGFLLDGEAVTHVVLEQGHLWGRHEVVIPVSAVRAVSNDEVRLTLTTEKVEALPRPQTIKRP